MIALSSTYLGPLSYYSLLKENNDVTIDIGEHYKKQTYRNRCHICSPNGLLKLSIPIQHKGEHVPIKDVLISNTYDWQTLHWRSIEAAYRRSPYFEYYEELFIGFYKEKQYKFLIDFTTPLLKLVLEKLALNVSVNFSEKYIENPSLDHRDTISPKKDYKYTPSAYIQVFESKTGHLANPSIIDLLFNEGPNSMSKL